MNKKFNPFKPNSPVYTGLFSGRIDEITRIDDLLYQTKHNNPSHILILGERGIGKTSLLLVAKHLSQGNIEFEEKYNFLTIQFSINSNTKIIDLAKRINSHIKRVLDENQGGIAFLSKTWDFISKFEVANIRYKSYRNINCGDEELIDKTIYSIVDTVKAITEDTAMSELGLRQKKDGIVILIDEVDSASKDLNLGAFLKILSETLVQENAEKVLIILSGLPIIRDILKESHESSLRLFEELKLDVLSNDDIKQVIFKGLQEAKNQGCDVTINDEALDSICTYSEGYPHFIQQIGYSAFDYNVDNIIDKDDVAKSMFTSGGAIEKIGDRYYRDMFYNQIKEDSYRQILKIMAQKSTSWISKSEIKTLFKGKETTLNNGLRALRKRNIILSKPGSRGKYRLQWIGFAVWIKYFSQTGSVSFFV